MIQVTGWDRWQTYRSDRGAPPWIKVYRNLISNPEWAMLTDAEKGQLVSLWILAAERNGILPSDDVAILRKIAQLDHNPNINKFIELGFLTSSGCQDDANVPPQRQRQRQRQSIEQDGMRFDEFWQAYPRKKEKAKVKKWWETNAQSEKKQDEIISGLKKHLPGMMAKEKQYIPHPTTWLNGERWNDEVEGSLGADSQDWMEGAI